MLNSYDSAYCVVARARENGFDNVIALDCANVAFDGGGFVATFVTDWLDACEGEETDLALLDMEILEHVNGRFESVGCGLAELENGLAELERFTSLFVC